MLSCILKFNTQVSDVYLGITRRGVAAGNRYGLLIAANGHNTVIADSTVGNSRLGVMHQARNGALTGLHVGVSPTGIAMPIEGYGIYVGAEAEVHTLAHSVIGNTGSVNSEQSCVFFGSSGGRLYNLSVGVTRSGAHAPNGGDGVYFPAHVRNTTLVDSTVGNSGRHGVNSEVPDVTFSGLSVGVATFYNQGISGPLEIPIPNRQRGITSGSSAHNFSVTNCTLGHNAVAARMSGQGSSVSDSFVGVTPAGNACPNQDGIYGMASNFVAHHNTIGNCRSPSGYGVVTWGNNSRITDTFFGVLVDGTPAPLGGFAVVTLGGSGAHLENLTIGYTGGSGILIDSARTTITDCRIGITPDPPGAPSNDRRIPLSGIYDIFATNLQTCVDHCDADSQCAEGLSCFQRDHFEPVPGCSGTGELGWDYCYDPSVDGRQFHSISGKGILGGDNSFDLNISDVHIGFCAETAVQVKAPRAAISNVVIGVTLDGEPAPVAFEAYQAQAGGGWFPWSGVSFDKDATGCTLANATLVNILGIAVDVASSDVVVANATMMDVQDIGVRSHGDAENLTIKDVKIRNVGSHGIQLLGARSRVFNAQIGPAAAYGVDVSGSRNHLSNVLIGKGRPPHDPPPHIPWAVAMRSFVCSA